MTESSAKLQFYALEDLPWKSKTTIFFSLVGLTRFTMILAGVIMIFQKEFHHVFLNGGNDFQGIYNI